MRDEVTEFLDARYVGAPEATWRLLGFKLHGRSHPVERLPVHLENQENVLFTEGHEAAAAESAQARTSKLDAWFALNWAECRAAAAESGITWGEDVGPAGALLAARELTWPAKHLRFSDVPQFYVWDSKATLWRRRKRGPRGGEVIGRLAQVSPKDPERFALRLLLLHTPGALSREDLKGGRGTYREAAMARGLWEDSEEIQRTLDEAIHIRTSPNQLCELFAHLLVWLDVADAPALWATNWMSLAEIFLRTHTPDQAHDEALRIVDDALRHFGLSAAHFSLGYRCPQPPVGSKAEAIRRERAAFHPPTERALHDAMDDLLPGQLEVYNEVLAALLQKMHRTPEQETLYNEILAALGRGPATDGPNVFYVDGPGGAGKTYLYTKVIRWARAEGLLPVVVAMSGIAALLLPGGTTAHSRFKLPVPLPLEDATANMNVGSDAAAVLRAASLLVWDEAPMASKSAVDAVDRCLRDVRGVDEPFGGLPTLLGGDFRQIPPVLRHIDRGEFAPYTIKAARVWQGERTMRAFSLTYNKRAEGDADFASFLQEIGDGTYPTLENNAGTPQLDAGAPRVDHPSAVRLPESISMPPDSSPVDLLDWVYAGFDDALGAAVETKLQYFAERALVTPTNEAAAGVNAAMLERCPGAAVDFLSRDSIPPGEADAAHYPVEFLNSLDSGGLPPHCLRLKPGALLMAVRNFAPHLGVCNGTRLLLEHAGRRLLRVRIVTGPRRNDVVLLPRITCDSAGEADLPFRMRRFQFPVRPAWAMTINKSQGQTLSGRVGVWLPEPVFAHGQLYVALSRAVSANGVRVLATPYDRQQGYDGNNVCTLNVVNREYLAAGRVPAAAIRPPGEGTMPRGDSHTAERDGDLGPSAKTGATAWALPAPRRPAPLGARGAGALRDIEITDVEIGQRTVPLAPGEEQGATEETSDLFADEAPSPARPAESVAAPDWITVEQQRAAFCAVHALNNVFQGRLPPAVTEDELFQGAVEAASDDRRERRLRRADAHCNEGTGYFSTEAVACALRARGCGARGCTRRETPAATMQDAFDSFPEVSDEAEKAVLGIFLHHGQVRGGRPRNHYTALVRDKDDPLRAWHIDSMGRDQVTCVGPDEFAALVDDADTTTLRIGCDPATWYAGERGGADVDMTD